MQPEKVTKHGGHVEKLSKYTAFGWMCPSIAKSLVKLISYKFSMAVE